MHLCVDIAYNQVVLTGKSDCETSDHGLRPVLFLAHKSKICLLTEHSC